MLKLINLFIIDTIINKVAKVKLSAKSQMIYINCLIHHFKDLEATESNSVAFHLFEEDFGDYLKFKTNIQELHKAGLVMITSSNITFINLWATLIDKTLYDKEYVTSENAYSLKDVKAYEKELFESEQLIELSMMKYKLSKTQAHRLIELFVKEQQAFQKKYNTFSDCIKHCTYWIGMNHHKSAKETVISNNKMLGK
jgi:hypothetical protein